MQVGIFGGSFDPPHMGHVLAAVYARSLGLDHVLAVVVSDHAFGKGLSAFEHRMSMARRAFEPVSGVEVSDVERHLPSPNYTLNTVRHLQSTHPDWRFRLIIGSDVVSDLQRWHGARQLVRLAPPLILTRAGYLHDAKDVCVLPDISSTQVRRALGADSADTSWLDARVPRRVLDYILEEGLYYG